MRMDILTLNNFECERGVSYDDAILFTWDAPYITR